MEITGIDKIQTIKKAGESQEIQKADLEDTISISSEAKKRSEWVEMLKQMPDIRQEKIEPLTVNPPTFAEVAQKIVDQIL